MAATIDRVLMVSSPRNIPKRLRTIICGGIRWMMPNSSPVRIIALAAVEEFLNPLRMMPRKSNSSITAGIMLKAVTSIIMSILDWLAWAMVVKKFW